jgi:hypothetical protein
MSTIAEQPELDSGWSVASVALAIFAACGSLDVSILVHGVDSRAW